MVLLERIELSTSPLPRETSFIEVTVINGFFESRESFVYLYYD